MSEINKPEQIIVDKLTLKQVPAQQEYAQQIFNAFHEDEPSFKFWMEDGIYKSVSDVLNAYKTKYNDFTVNLLIF